MNAFFFWKFWSKPDRILFYFFALLTFSALIFFWHSWWITPEPVITYDNYQQLEKIESVSHTFQVGTLQFAVPAESQVILESLLSGTLTPNTVASYLFIGAMLIAFVGFVSIVSTLSRFYFYGGIGLVILFITNLGVSDLSLFSLPNQVITAGLVLIFGGLGFYFNSFYKSASLSFRVAIFSIVTLLLILVIHFFSKTPYAFLHLSVNVVSVAFVVTLVFVIMTSHEIVAGIVTIATTTKSTKSLPHFLILTTAYLINVALLYASKTGLISWNFLPVNSFFLLTLSIIFGYWGFQKITRDGILSDEPTAALLYSCLALVCLATLGLLSSTANDMMLDAFEVILLATHFACGLIFSLYIISNFGPMLAKNFAVHKIIYKPETMPLFTFRVMSLIAAFATITLVASWKRYVDQATATYFNLTGDMYLSQRDDTKAETSYKQALRFRNQNLHAHYALASLYARRYESFNEKKEFEKILNLSPDPHAFITMNEIFTQEKNELRGNLILTDGVKFFPKNAELKNAIGLSFLKFKTVDSALYYFKSAAKSHLPIAETNVLATRALFHLADLDSTKPWSTSIDGTLVNRLAIANGKNLRARIEAKVESDTLLSVYQAAYYSNLLINRKDLIDTVLENQILRLANKPCNEDFSEMLLASVAQNQYARGEVKKALKGMRELAFRTQSANHFNVIGLWLLEQKNPLLASVYFEKAVEKKMNSSLYRQAFAQTESGHLENGYALWDSLSHAKDTEVKRLADRMKNAIAFDPKKKSSLTDEEKYYFLRYRVSVLDSVQFDFVFNDIQNPKLKAEAILDRAEKWFAWDESAKAEKLTRPILEINDPTFSPRVRSLRMMIAANQRDVVFIKKNSAWVNALPPVEKAYIEAILAQANGDQKTVATKYNYLAQANDQFEEGLVAASRFLAKDTTQRLQHFSYLVDGLLAKPNSVKILKEYILQAIGLGLEQDAQDALEKLHTILPDRLFKKFADAHPDLFQAQ